MQCSPKCLTMLVSLFVLSCVETADDFASLKVGDRAIYDVEYIAPLVGLQRAEAIVRTEGKEKIGSYEYFRIVTVIQGIPGVEPETVYQRTAKDGLYELRYIKNNPVEYLSLPIPLEVGKAWSVETPDSAATCRIDSKQPAIMPVKTYSEAYKIACSGTREGITYVTDTYQVKNVGAVRTVFKSEGFTMEFRLREVGKEDV